MNGNAQCGDCQGRWKRLKAGHRAMDRDLTWGGEHTVQCTDDALYRGAPKTCSVLLTSVNPINSIKNKLLLLV